MAEPDRHIRTDPDISAYQDYLPDEWGPKAFASIPEKTVLERLLFDLALAWRTASYTAQMPATSIRAMHAAALGRGEHVTTDRSIITYSERIVAQLSRRVPELCENSALRARLVAELATISSELRDRVAAVQDDFPIQHIWADFMSQPAYRLSLWSSQRISYVAFYNAYEAFLVGCLKVATGQDSLRPTDRNFHELLRTALGKDISGPCWSHHEINIPRLIRHALSHNGGRVTRDLEKQKHGIDVIDGELQIMPADIKRMLERLRKAVDEIVAAARSTPNFASAFTTQTGQNESKE